MSFKKLLGDIHNRFSRDSVRNAHTIPFSIMGNFEKEFAKISDVIHLSWYESLCRDNKDMEFESPSAPHIISSSPPSQSVLRDDLDNLSSAPSSVDASTSPHFSCWSQPCSPSAHSSDTEALLNLSPGDIVHLRSVVDNSRKAKDVLAYSCLALLRAYFPQTKGLRSYAFYRSLNGSRLAGVGVWRDIDAASTFLHVADHGGTCAEKFWRSIGSRPTFDIYEVATLVV
ncbi:hypothetical protein KP509_29G078000 [Ceratopteris richardii]|nr:hypothetical protein KP509_29G078000 [Ceratopteris richardii]